MASSMPVEEVFPSTDLVVVVPCSQAKAERPAPAADLYTGPYHRQCRRAAEALTATGGRWLILSGLHGLVTPDTRLAPYEHRFGKDGSITPERLREQATVLGIAEAQQVVVLAGRTYAQAAQQVWPHAHTPLVGIGGIGRQRARLAEIIRRTRENR